MDRIGRAARASRRLNPVAVYAKSDKVDQMILLYAILCELRELRKELTAGRTDSKIA